MTAEDLTMLMTGYLVGALAGGLVAKGMVGLWSGVVIGSWLGGLVGMSTAGLGVRSQTTPSVRIRRRVQWQRPASRPQELREVGQFGARTG